jgi:hypothetical protein
VANAMMAFQLKMANTDYSLKFVINAGDSFYHRGVTQFGELQTGKLKCTDADNRLTLIHTLHRRLHLLFHLPLLTSY